MVSLIFTEQAKKDLKGIHAFIAKDSHFNATRFIGQLIDKSSILKSYPEIGHLVFPGKFKHLRQLLYKSYRIVYSFSVDKNSIFIITIHHQSRLLTNISVVRNYTE